MCTHVCGCPHQCDTSGDIPVLYWRLEGSDVLVMMFAFPPVPWPFIAVVFYYRYKKGWPRDMERDALQPRTWGQNYNDKSINQHNQAPCNFPVVGYAAIKTESNKGIPQLRLFLLFAGGAVQVPLCVLVSERPGVHLRAWTGRQTWPWRWTDLSGEIWSSCQNIFKTKWRIPSSLMNKYINALSS